MINRYINVIGEIDANAFRNYCAIGMSDPEALRYGVLISSPGGDIGYTLAMLDDIDFNKRTTHATGICQSAAAVLATAGEGKRVCTMDALFRFMPAETEIMDDPDAPGEQVERVPDLRNYLQSVLVNRVAQRLKINAIEAADFFDGKFITSVRAKELGLIDEVISTEAPNGSADRLSGSERQIDGWADGLGNAL